MTARTSLQWPQYERERCRRPSTGLAVTSSQLGGGATGGAIFSLAEPVNLSTVTWTATSDLAVAENLDELVLANGALGDELVDRDLCRPRGTARRCRRR